MHQDKQKILVVNGDPAARSALSLALGELGYEVLHSSGSADTAQIVPLQNVDLVLFETGTVDGGRPALDVLRLLRATYTDHVLPILIAATGADGIEAMRTGASDCLPPTGDPQMALARIAVHLKRKKEADESRARSQRFELAAESTGDGIWDWDLRSGSIYFSPRWKELLGFAENELESSPDEWFGRVHEEDQSRLQLLLSEVGSDGGPSEMLSQHRVRHKNGSFRHVEIRGQIRREGSNGTAMRIAGVMKDTTAKRIYDPLTGLPNRGFLMDALQKAIEYREGHRRWGFALVLVNLDQYAAINSVFGHESGDQLLIEAASRLQRAVRSSEGGESHLVAYLGSDEFAVLLGGVDDLRTAQEAAAKMQAEFGHSFLLEGTEVFACATIGVALWHDGYRRATEMLRDVDLAVREAKAKGGSRIALFDLQMQQESIRRLELSLEVQRGLDLDEFEIYYQPVIRLENGAVAGFEGLLRWRHPERGVLAPDQFLAHAESTGLVIPLGVFSLRHAAVSIRQLQHRFPSDPPLYVGINVSPREVRQPGLASRVEDILNTAGVDPSALVLEINQRAFQGDGETAALALHQVKSLGVRLRLDNATIDPQALRYLSRGLFDSVKISRQLVQSMTTNEESADIVRTLCTVAKGLSIESLAEGVEDQVQAQLAMEAGTMFAQGYLFAPPLTVPDAVDYMTQVRV